MVFFFFIRRKQTYFGVELRLAKNQGSPMHQKDKLYFFDFSKFGRIFFKKNAEPDPSRSDSDQILWVDFQKSRWEAPCGRTARRRRPQIFLGVLEDQRKVFDFLKFFSRVEFFFENAKMHIASLKNSEIGPLRIRGGFRVSS